MSVVQQRDLFPRRVRKFAAPQKEVTLHIQLVAMLRHCIRPDVIWRHIPLGEHRDPRTAAKLKAMGTMPGAADLEFHWIEADGDGKKRCVLHLELKAGNRKQSEPQVAYELAMRLLGDQYHVARSIDEAITILGTRGLIKSNVEVCGRRW